MSDVASQKRSDLVHSSSTSSFFLLANTSGVWLLWMSITLDVVLLSLGFHWFVAKSVAVVPFIKWFLETVDLSIVVKNFLFWVTEIFFKSFDIGGADNVPIEGPVIFACAPHNNQFIDGIVAMRALNARKDVGFIAAASSCRKPYEGKIIKLLGSIPVERPQDVASVGVGTLRFDPAKRVVAGKGTKFSSQVRKGDTFVVGKIKGVVESIESDTVALLKNDVVVPPEDYQPYKIIPHLDQSKFFDSVLQRLREGKAVGIFPEGGSHDRTELLPLKAGIALMALESVASGKTGIVPIIPVGINYFNGHRFRSRCFVDIGKPVVPSNELLEQYKRGGEEKREACRILLQNIRAGLGLVTQDAPNYNLLQFFRTINKMYVPISELDKMSEHDRLEMVNAFSQRYEHLKDQKEVKELFQKCREYQLVLKAHRVPDHKVRMAKGDETIADMTISLLELSLKLLALIPLTFAAVVGFIVGLPIMVISRYISNKKAALALKKSTVKISGRDVIGTWKVLTSIVLAPLLTLAYVWLAYWYFGETGATLVFFLAPLLLLLGIKAVETWKKMGSDVRILIFNAIRKSRGNWLVGMREDLKRDVRRVVKKFHWDEKVNSQHYRRASYSDYGTGFDDDDVDDLMLPRRAKDD